MMIINIKQKRVSAGGPELERSRTTKFDAAIGAEVEVAKDQRGVLSRTITYLDAETFKKVAAQSESLPQWTEEYRDELRDELESAGLPSDRNEIWISDDGIEWQPLTGIHLDPNRKIIPWFDLLKRVAEPLSKEWFIADLLLAMSHILDRPGIDHYFWKDIWELAAAHGNLRVTKFNNLAASGVRTAKSLEAGREQRKTGKQKQDIVWKHAVQHRAEHPLHADDATSIAKVIADRVNDELRHANLLNKKGESLSEKRIADYIRAAKKVEKNSR